MVPGREESRGGAWRSVIPELCREVDLAAFDPGAGPSPYPKW